MEFLIVILLLFITISVIGIDVNLRRKLKQDRHLLDKLDQLLEQYKNKF